MVRHVRKQANFNRGRKRELGMRMKAFFMRSKSSWTDPTRFTYFHAPLEPYTLRKQHTGFRFEMREREPLSLRLIFDTCQKTNP